MTLNFQIEDCSFVARTEIGTYRYGDWGIGKAFLQLPGGEDVVCKWDEVCEKAQKHYNEKVAK